MAAVPFRDFRHCERSEAIQHKAKALLDCFVATLLAMTVMMSKEPAVYIVANRRNGTLYVGVTSNLTQRVYQHREGMIEGFTNRYGCKQLVWFEMHGDMEHAITREKQIKGGSRARKLTLIESMNPDWSDLYETLF